MPQSYHHQLNEKNLHEKGTKKAPYELQKNDLIYSNFPSYAKYFIFFKNLLQLSYKRYKKVLLHTNASRDFLIAPKKALGDVPGYIETDLYWAHIDSYLCVQLFAAGYKQAILAAPHTAFHSDHSRAEVKRGPEAISYREHAKIFEQICRGKKPYKINPDTWGLQKFALSLEK